MNGSYHPYLWTRFAIAMAPFIAAAGLYHTLAG